MEKVIDITYFDLALGYLLLILPIAVLQYYRTGLVKSTLIATARMTVQLLLVGFYLEYFFKLNYVWINLLWICVMVIIATFTTIKRSELSYKVYLFPVLISVLSSLILVDAYFLGVVIRLDNVFDARYFIPITGMILGNCLQNNIIALNTFHSRLQKEQTLYRFYLANGATRSEALAPFIREALQKSFNPTIATMAVIGLISLPGMMTGQILGGSSPSVAIKYQIMLMITIFVSSVITVVSTLFLSNYFVFNDFDMLKEDVKKEK